MNITQKEKTRRLAIVSLSIAFVASLVLAIFGYSNVSYLLQAIGGHFRIMNSREPIDKILKANYLDVESKRKLQLVLQIRAYASDELGLPNNKSYTVYSDIKSQYIGWNVYIAPRFSVDPKQWCFPVAGCVVYRGYFSKDKALAFARTRHDESFDVFIGPINAYSTLGWYDDPVLSSHLRLPTIRLAGLIVHELAHQKVYVSGDSRFNEGFAVTVERAGILRWLKSMGRDDQIIQALGLWDKDDLAVARLLSARARLNDMYQGELDSQSLSERKNSLFLNLRKDLCGNSCAGKDLPKTNGEDFEMNNAYLVAIDTYYSLVPMFQNMLDSVGDNLPQFFEQVEELGKLPFDVRQRKIELLQKKLTGMIEGSKKGYWPDVRYMVRYSNS
ncbi:MAG: hypothetical protein A3J28_01650 [Acidobacteria bacterium RIFCSPLOWO2_12_FULL_60_22]|nr:MAG: hypothetical protein A3J28_01650 [Acidobacteria bacterium RIFCSPLOWO2_12_FULL_60_22]